MFSAAQGHFHAAAASACSGAGAVVQSLTLALLLTAGPARADFCALLISSEPTGAELYLDGRHAGTTPYVLQTNHPLKVQVKMLRKGFRTWEQTVHIPHNLILPLHVALTPAKKR